MRFRLGVLVGFGAGYYLGAKAGRERYHEINQWMGRAKESDVIDSVADKAKAATDLTMERAKDLVDGAFKDDKTAATSRASYSPSRKPRSCWLRMG
jgi:hypothetical protein